MKKSFCFLIVFLLYVFVFCQDRCFAQEAYSSVCNENVEAEGKTYKNCGNGYIHTLPDDKERSSGFRSTRKFGGDESRTIYIGKENNIDTFYTMGFYYYSVVYDDMSIANSDKNYWTTVSINGWIAHNSSFEDIPFVDQSKKIGNIFFNVEGEYLIKQYIGNEVVNVLRVYVIGKQESDVGVASVKYGNKDIDSLNLIGLDSDFTIEMSGGKYGFGENVDVSINSCSFAYPFAKSLMIYNKDIKSCLNYKSNNLSLSIYNGFGGKEIFKYSFNINSNDVFIKLEDSVSEVETSSRRVLIKAYAGEGKEIDEQYNLYYWSMNPDDSLSYESFIKNYENSAYKGTYSSHKGVILRNAVGTYYLYALAKDDDSVAVVRSDEYILKEEKILNEIMLEDTMLVLGLCVGAVLPIVIYLIIRGKDTD